MTSYWHPELGSGATWTPDDVVVVHFGNCEEFYQGKPDTEAMEELRRDEPREVARKKERNMNSRQERHRRVFWRRK